MLNYLNQIRTKFGIAQNEAEAVVVLVDTNLLQLGTFDKNCLKFVR